MNEFLAFLQAHPTVAKVAILAPILLMLHRLSILEQRNAQHQLPDHYGIVAAVLGFMPVVNIPLAVLCTLRTALESLTGYTDQPARW